MEKRDFITVEQFCNFYSIPVSFINDLQEYELIEVKMYRKTQCIEKAQISEIEKIMRLHFDLEINMEGIDVIYNLLRQVSDLQKQVTQLTNKLDLLE